MHYFLALLAMSQPFAVNEEGGAQKGIRVLPVARTSESNTTSLAVAFPEMGQVVEKNPVWIQFRLDGYSLGANSPFDRADEIANTNAGQTVHVIIDNRPYFAINEPAIDPLDEEGYFYDTRYKFEVPFSLREGMHAIRCFPARSFGESLKGENTFRALSFYVGEVKENPEMDLSLPYLTYNEPSDFIPLKGEFPVLLDFLLSNCELSPDGYKVRLIIDRKIKRTLTSWQPYYIYGLKRGRHTVRLQLIDPDGKKAPGIFNDTQRTIEIR